MLHKVDYGMVKLKVSLVGVASRFFAALSHSVA